MTASWLSTGTRGRERRRRAVAHPLRVFLDQMGRFASHRETVVGSAIRCRSAPTRSRPLVNSSDGVRFELLFTLKEKLLVRRNPPCRVSEIRKSLLFSS